MTDFSRKHLILNTYLERYRNVKGFMSPENATVWDFFLRYQIDQGICGNLMEIGI